MASLTPMEAIIQYLPCCQQLMIRRWMLRSAHSSIMRMSAVMLQFNDSWDRFHESIVTFQFRSQGRRSDHGRMIWQLLGTLLDRGKGFIAAIGLVDHRRCSTISLALVHHNTRAMFLI